MTECHGWLCRRAEQAKHASELQQQVSHMLQLVHFLQRISCGQAACAAIGHMASAMQADPIPPFSLCCHVEPHAGPNLGHGGLWQR